MEARFFPIAFECLIEATDDVGTEEGLFMDSLRKERGEARFNFVSYPIAFESLTKAGIEGKTM